MEEYKIYLVYTFFASPYMLQKISIRVFFSKRYCIQIHNHLSCRDYGNRGQRYSSWKSIKNGWAAKEENIHHVCTKARMKSDRWRGEMENKRNGEPWKSFLIWEIYFFKYILFGWISFFSKKKRFFKGFFLMNSDWLKLKFFIRARL